MLILLLLAVSALHRQIAVSSSLAVECISLVNICLADDPGKKELLYVLILYPV